MFGTTYIERILSAVTDLRSKNAGQHGSMATKAGLAFACTLAVLVFRHRMKTRIARAASARGMEEEAFPPNPDRVDTDVDMPAAMAKSKAHEERLLAVRKPDTPSG